MNSKQRQILITASETLRLLDCPREANALDRVVHSLSKHSPKFTDGFNHLPGKGIRYREAFAAWYARSDWDDPEAGYRDFRGMDPR